MIIKYRIEVVLEHFLTKDQNKIKIIEELTHLLEFRIFTRNFSFRKIKKFINLRVLKFLLWAFELLVWCFLFQNIWIKTIKINFFVSKFFRSSTLFSVNECPGWKLSSKDSLNRTIGKQIQDCTLFFSEKSR